MGEGAGPSLDGGLPGLGAFGEATGTVFRVEVDDERWVEVTLVEVKHADVRPGWEAFSLLFVGPRAPFPQATYAVEHEALGSFPLFLVPIATDEGGQRYEAVFNRPMS